MSEEPHPCNYVNLKRAERTIPLEEEFTKKIRSFVKMYENEMPRRAEITFLEEACVIIDRLQAKLDTSEAENRRLKKAIEDYGNNPAGFDWAILEKIEIQEARLKEFQSKERSK